MGALRAVQDRNRTKEANPEFHAEDDNFLMLIQYRKAMAAILMILGAAMLVRGLTYAVRAGLGWQGIIPALVVGVLVFALGFARWRYLRQR